MSITDWPEAERPREKLIRRGAATLSDAELLAIFLRTGVVGASAVDLARQLLNRFDGLRGLFEADKDSFCACKGMGLAKYVQLQAVLEMGRRYLAATLSVGQTLTSPATVRAFLTAQLRHETHEVFACLLLDNQHRLLGFEPLFHGTINATSVYPREVVTLALERHAAAMILAHNHPSGVAEPSTADREITRRLVDGLALVDVRVLDHMVIGDGEVVSFAERGWL